MSDTLGLALGGLGLFALVVFVAVGVYLCGLTVADFVGRALAEPDAVGRIDSGWFADTDTACRAFAHLVGCGPEREPDALARALDAAVRDRRCGRCGDALGAGHGVAPGGAGVPRAAVGGSDGVAVGSGVTSWTL